MNITKEELDFLRKACRGGNLDVADYLKYTGKDSICYADEHYILHLKYGYILDAECSPEGQVQKAIKAVEAGHDGPEYISAR